MSKQKKTRKQVTAGSTGSQKHRFRNWHKVVLGVATLALAGGLIWLPGVNMAGAPEITVYKSATCGCCRKWVDHLRDEGFKVITHNRQDMGRIKQSYGVEYNLRSCHTAVVEDYVLEGHVPAADIRRLLEERPAVTGLAVPGMPMGSPGMEGKYQDPYDVVAFDETGKKTTFARY